MPENTENKDSHRIPVLDGLRGIAILMVMLYHFTWFPFLFGGESLWKIFGQEESYILKILLSGWAGVDLFFVLSGFLITGILTDATAGKGYFSSFYMRRFCRIYPLYLLFLILAPWFLKFFPPKVAMATGSYNLWLLSFTSNILIAQNGWESVPLPIQHFWSLAVEWQFYILWPFFIVYLGRRKAISLCLVLMAVALTARILHHSWYARFILTHSRFDSLAAGSLLALASREINDKMRLRFWAHLLAISSFTSLLLLFIFRGGLDAEDQVVTTIGLSLLSLFFMAIIGVCQFGERTLFARIVSILPLRLFGKYSYGAYLIHQPVVIFLWSTGLMNPLLTPAVSGTRWRSAAGILFGIFIPMVISFLIAIISWHGFEKHFLNRKFDVREFWDRIKRVKKIK